MSFAIVMHSDFHSLSEDPSGRLCEEPHFLVPASVFVETENSLLDEGSAYNTRRNNCCSVSHALLFIEPL